MNSAIIVAGGSGQRFGSKTPKQFLKIGGKEILEYSVHTFYNHPEIDEVIVVTKDVLCSSKLILELDVMVGWLSFTAVTVTVRV